ncbi:PP2C family protein-serine/threonine phosphatase [Amphibacillus jilinensis]|uniref:PP2C family protein-serine/threonine phosphatase n=1 Tax=Amphibacillus jilinensis TaxID=1216008 RepID=UPI00036965D4|nr:PP2C family serine/threonine-protein phosphatase [Amphibacillus jilinensis]
MLKRNQTWSIGQSTDKGPVKKTNEDRMLLQIIKDPTGDEMVFALVADGMGGYQYGDLASQTIIDYFNQWFVQHHVALFQLAHPFIYLEQALPQAFNSLNQKLIAYGAYYHKKLGSTLTLLALYKGRYFVGHVGDSRVYHWEKIRPYQFNQTDRLYPTDPETESLAPHQTLSQLTDDHSWVSQQVRQGHLSKRAASAHPKRHVLLQCVGIEEKLAPYFRQGTYQANDLFVLCSDGFHTIFPEHQLLKTIQDLKQQRTAFQTRTDQLVQQVSKMGATDNITLIMIQPHYIEKPIGLKRRIINFFLS